MRGHEETMQTIARGRLESIDFLRGVAAFMVVVCHAASYGDFTTISDSWFQNVVYLLSQGHLGVPLFFVISGFCIHAQWSKKFEISRSVGFDFRAFWKRRLVRLYPPYLVALCISMGLMVVALYMEKSIGLLEIYPERSVLWLGLDFVSHVFMLHGFHPVFDTGGGNSVYWTLAREEYLYALYFVILLFRRRLSMFAINVIILSISLGAYAWAFQSMADSDCYRILRTSVAVLWIQWSLGCSSVEDHLGIVKLPKVFFMLGWVPVFLVAPYFLQGIFTVCGPALTGVGFWILLNYCVRREREGTWPKHAFFKWWSKVGIFSYSLYLFHYPAIGIAKQLMGPLTRTTHPWMYLVNVAILTGVGYGAGKLFFYAVERHFLRPSDSKNTRADEVPPVGEPALLK